MKTVAAAKLSDLFSPTSAINVLAKTPDQYILASITDTNITTAGYSSRKH